MTAFANFRTFLLGCGLLAGLSGCGAMRDLSSDSLRPYVPEVVQGNVVSREQRQALRPGMSRAQVKDILGTPLIASVFHADRWDYLFTIRRQGVPPQQFRLSLGFQGDQLSSIDGDELPSEAEFAQRLSRPRNAGAVPVLEASNEQLEKFPARQAATTAPSAALPLPATYPPLESAPR